MLATLRLVPAEKYGLFSADIPKFGRSLSCIYFISLAAVRETIRDSFPFGLPVGSALQLFVFVEDCFTDSLDAVRGR